MEFIYNYYIYENIYMMIEYSYEYIIDAIMILIIILFNRTPAK